MRPRGAYGRATVVVPWSEPVPAATRLSPAIDVVVRPESRMRVWVLENVIGRAFEFSPVQVPEVALKIAIAVPVRLTIETELKLVPEPAACNAKLTDEVVTLELEDAIPTE